MPPRSSTLHVKCGNHQTKRRHIPEYFNFCPTQALNKTLGFGWLLCRSRYDLRAGLVGYEAVRRSDAACWHSCCLFGKTAMKIWAKQPSRLLWGSLIFMSGDWLQDIGHNNFPTSMCINWKKNTSSSGILILVLLHFYFCFLSISVVREFLLGFICL
jgi:hypothetical protein